MTLLSKLEKTTVVLSGKILNSVLVTQKTPVNVGPSIPRVQKWTNYSNITANGPSITCSRMFNSKVVKNIPEEYFEIGNFKCKSGDLYTRAEHDLIYFQ